MAYNPEAHYVIDIPGVQDFIRIPAMEDGQLKRERILRMKQNLTERPGWVNKIGAVAAALDNAQDLLYTGLVLAKPLLKRLPAAFIPGIGWILLINDVVNLTSALMSLFATGPSGKSRNFQLLDILGSSRQSRIKAASQFLNKTPWLPFLIQGGQAMQSLTGYGVNLGAAMGAVQDVIWTPYAMHQGKKIRIQGPPENDIGSKAARYLVSAAALNGPNVPMSEDDWSLKIAADAVASYELANPATAARLATRGATIGATPLPVVEPWSPSTIEAMLEAGFDPTGQIDAGPALDDPTPTFGSASASAIARHDAWALERRAAAGASSRGTILQMINSQGAHALVDAANDGEENRGYLPDANDQIAAWSAESGIRLPATATAKDRATWHYAARWMTANEHVWTFEAIEQAAIAVFNLRGTALLPPPLVLIEHIINQLTWWAPFMPDERTLWYPKTKYRNSQWNAYGSNEPGTWRGY